MNLDKKESKEKKEKEKVNVAKDTQKKMEQWAKQLNQKKEAARKAAAVATPAAASVSKVTTAASLVEEKTGSADAVYSILERKVRHFVILFGNSIAFLFNLSTVGTGNDHHLC